MPSVKELELKSDHNDLRFEKCRKEILENIKFKEHFLYDIMMQK